MTGRYFRDDEREEFDRAMELEKSVAALRLANEAATLQTAMAQAAAQYQQMTGQPLDMSIINNIVNAATSGSPSSEDVPQQITTGLETGGPPEAGSDEQLVGTPQQGRKDIEGIAAGKQLTLQT